MDKKPTDAEIVKAYELCFAEKGTIQTCGKCPYHKFGKLCKVRRNRDALDLINRLQAENERLKKVSDIRLECLGRSRAKAKAEAYKEFVNKIKVHAYYIDFPKEHRVVDEDDIDNILKELEGENK